MSDLQLALIAVGAVVIAGVYAYNVLQERRYRRRAEAAFARPEGDALLQPAAGDSEEAEPPAGTAPAPAGRIEPRIGTAVADPVALPPVAAGDTPFDEEIDYVVALEMEPPAAIGPLRSELAGLAGGWSRSLVVAGREPSSGRWTEVDLDDEPLGEVRCGLQLAHRAGAATQQQIVAFRDAILVWAEQHDAKVTAPDPAEAAARAAELDRFCADVDVAVGVNVVAPKGAGFPATRIRELAEATGLRLEPDGVFHCRDAAGRTLFTLDNHEPMPFVPEQIRTMTTGGVTLLIDVPRTPDGAHAFDQMVATGRELAAGLGGTLVDDNRVALTDAGVAKIRTQLVAIQLRMADQGIVAGSRRARRLFA